MPNTPPEPDAATSAALPASAWPRGSEWRKWDLHVHSPASHNFSGEWDGFIIQLGNADCDVIGINDYFSIHGYREVVARLDGTSDATTDTAEYLEAIEKLRGKTLLPVVECRMTNVVIGRSAKSGTRVNFHIIFDPALSHDDMETFLKGLKVKDQSIGTRYADAQFLFDDVAIDFNTVFKELNDDRTFAGRFLIWIPYNEYGGIDDINPKTDKLLKEGLVSKADFLGSANQKQADFFLWRDQRYTEEQYREWFGRRKACIKGSDSHATTDEIGRLKDENSTPIDKYCWIKADPTFQGLQQVTNEPGDRVWIGQIPPKLDDIRANRTRYMASVSIQKRAGADHADHWFDCTIPLNCDMVAIIGNKGSGKSALADILALAGNTHTDPEHFSFLTKSGFCERNNRIAKNFQASLAWEDGNPPRTVTLDGKASLNDVERVKYIPQKYLETICTETAPGEESAFQIELRKVIFSHISEADKLEKESLEDLIEYKTEELRDERVTIREDISRLNAELLRLEEKAGANHRAQLESRKDLKQKELDAHLANKPAEVEAPASLDAAEQAAYDAVRTELDRESGRLSELDDKIAGQRGAAKSLADQLARAEKLDTRLTNFGAEAKRLREETEEDFTRLSLDFDAMVEIRLDRQPLTQKIALLRSEKKLVEASLDEDTEDGLPQQRLAVVAQITALQDRLDAPTKRYEQYKESLKTWETTRDELQGGADKPDTLKYFEAQLDYISKGLPAEIEKAKESRREAARRLHGCISGIRDVYEELFGSVQKLIEDSVLIREGFKLTFQSSIFERTFQRELFDKYINQGVSGSFCGKEKGEHLLEELRAERDVNSAEDAIALVEDVIRHLSNDLRPGRNDSMEIADQLRKHVTLQGLYDYLWSFEYLQPEYSLKLDGKDLSQLSPGERGTLLLVFYLLVDKSNAPIVVDQPEENLDNQTVYRLLIPVIKEVKQRRQLVMVTHNPNIAVVCDAEQIIHANIDRADGNRVAYTMGAIESPELNQHLIDVLEGTRPAFENRESKYQSRRG